MKYSKLFGRAKKDAKEFDSKNATLLMKAGFVDQVMAGVYSYLPLGIKVLSKIEAIVREEMDKIGQEVVLPALSPKENWEKTGRLGIDVLFQVTGANELSKARNDASYILNPTHEDLITPLVQKFGISYKDFPIALYQIQNKFRNEARPKSGLLRGREFRMKDLYSFHTSKEDLMNYYEIAKAAYTKVFERLGLGEQTVVALASGGDFTKNFSHEFQTKCEAGEDIIFHDPKTGINYNREVTPSKAPDYQYGSEKLKREDIYGENIVSVEKLVDFLKVDIERTVKTLILEGDNNRVIVAAVRGDYELDELKLKKIAKTDSLKLASEEIVKRVTKAEIGYAGLINLPEDVELFVDDALQNAVNFECGTNKTHYHSINVNWDVDVAKPKQFFDIKVARKGDYNPETGSKYEVFNAAEVGNIFPLEIKFSKAFDFNFINEAGKSEIIYMGSYGIGTTRLMGVIAEVMSDHKGLVWPEQIAPFKVHLIFLGKAEDTYHIDAAGIYEQLINLGIEVLWDDRTDVGAGEKFADADLIGIPYRVVVSKKSMEQGGVEVKRRTSDEVSIVGITEIESALK